MAIEKLTSVQTVAEEFTEVASKTNELLEDYHIRQEDIEDYEVAHFGQNKFLISIIYMSSVLMGWTAKVALKLSTTLERGTTYRRKIAAIKLGLKVAVAMVTRFADVEILENIIALKNILVTGMKIIRKMGNTTVELLVLIRKFKSLAARKVSIAFAIAEIERGLFTANKVIKDASIALIVSLVHNKAFETISNTMGVKSIQFEALYNGVPIEE